MEIIGPRYFFGSFFEIFLNYEPTESVLEILQDTYLFQFLTQYISISIKIVINWVKITTDCQNGKKIVFLSI